MNFRAFIKQYYSARRERLSGAQKAILDHLEQRIEGTDGSSASDRFIQENEGCSPIDILSSFIRESIPEVTEVRVSVPYDGLGRLSGEFVSNYGSWQLMLNTRALEVARLSSLLTEAVQEVSVKLQEAKEMQEIRRKFEESDRINISNGVYDRPALDATTYAMTQAFLFGDRSQYTVVDDPVPAVPASEDARETLQHWYNLHRLANRRFEDSVNQAIAETHKLQERCRGCQNRNRDFDGHVAPEHLRDLKCAVNPVFAMSGVGECTDFEADEPVAQQGQGSSFNLQALINRLQSIPSVVQIQIESYKIRDRWRYELEVKKNGSSARRIYIDFSDAMERVVEKVMEGDR